MVRGGGWEWVGVGGGYRLSEAAAAEFHYTGALPRLPSPLSLPASPPPHARAVLRVRACVRACVRVRACVGRHGAWSCVCVCVGGGGGERGMCA